MQCCILVLLLIKNSYKTKAVFRKFFVHDLSFGITGRNRAYSCHAAFYVSQQSQYLELRIKVYRIRFILLRCLVGSEFVSAILNQSRLLTLSLIPHLDSYHEQKNIKMGPIVMHTYRWKRRRKNFSHSVPSYPSFGSQKTHFKVLDGRPMGLDPPPKLSVSKQFTHGLMNRFGAVQVVRERIASHDSATRNQKVGVFLWSDTSITSTFNS